LIVSFSAKFDSTCHVCNTSIDKGDDVVWYEEKVVHETCPYEDAFDEPKSIRDDYRSQYVKKAKEHPVCKSCNIIHPPDQECW
jgi:hypothetical protein